MKQDIRDLFGNDDDNRKRLPDNHRQEFYEKLKASRPKRQSKIDRSYLFKVAAMVTLFIALAVALFVKTDRIKNNVVEIPIETEIQAIEKKYLASIDKEWNNFLTIAKDEVLIKRFDKKLKDLDRDYQVFSEQFQNDKSNVLVIEALVNNLQTRLKLLKDIQEHINILNQKTEQHDNHI